MLLTRQLQVGEAVRPGSAESGEKGSTNSLMRAVMPRSLNKRHVSLAALM